MEDYEIRDIMRRATTGRPVVKIITQKQHESQNGTTFNFEFKVTNDSNEPVMYATISIIMDKDLIDLSERKTLGKFGIFESIIRKNMSPVDAWVLVQNWAIPNSMPIYKEIEYTIGSLVMTVKNDVLYEFGYKITCPGFQTERLSRIMLSNGRLCEVDNQEGKIFVDN